MKNHALTIIVSLLVLSASAEFKEPEQPKNVPPLGATTVADWEQNRRPALLKTFLEEEYGVRPVERPPDLSFSEIAAPETCYGGTVIRKRVRATYSGPGGKSAFVFSVWIPRRPHPVAVFVHSSPRPAETAADPNGPRPSYWLPVEDITGRGYAVVAYCNQEVALDWQMTDTPTNGVFKAYGTTDLAHRKPTEWGILSAWAWGMSRIVDWIETEPLLDARRIASVGLSRNGKTSLLAGVTDTRFGLVISCCSGCSGAKLNHMDNRGSETIRDISIARNWFTPNYMKYLDGDDKMPFDQHQFLALVAPRLLYVSSASEDYWAGPRGEFASAVLASEVWNLYGKAGLVHHGFPRPDHPLHAGNIGYHLRTGLHDITRYDWSCYMDFADGHGWNLP